MNVKPDVFGTFINVHEWDVASNKQVGMAVRDVLSRAAHAFL